MQMPTPNLYHKLQENATTFHRVVPFDATRHQLLQLDFSAANTRLTPKILANTDIFAEYIDQQLGARFTYGIGGYDEHRTIYARSSKFDDGEEPRRLHLGTDIWGAVDTPIFAPLDGYVHSFGFNDFYGDYGATIILQHQLDRLIFYTLYGHLSLRDISGIKQGDYISGGVEFAHFGPARENGQWPAHLHFQIITNMTDKKGDYPGVCKFSERDKYLGNCPDPDLILQMMQYAVKV